MAWQFSLLPHFSRCERAQHKITMTGLGSEPTFAAAGMTDRSADKADVRNDAASLLLVNDRTAGEAAFEGATTWLVGS